MKKVSRIENLSDVNLDILLLLNITKSIGWKETKINSIYRILYFASVLFLFRNQDLLNPFSEIYHFDISFTGIYSDEIYNSITFLQTNEYVKLNNENDSLNSNQINQPDLTKFRNYKMKMNWLEDIIYLLGKYGESKIYDFIIRDPQYLDNVQRNVIKGLDIDADNKTLFTLNSFKMSFEKTLKKDATQIDNREYLDLYFEYVFSKIIKGSTKI